MSQETGQSQTLFLNTLLLQVQGKTDSHVFHMFNQKLLLISNTD